MKCRICGKETIDPVGTFVKNECKQCHDEIKELERVQGKVCTFCGKVYSECTC